MRIKNMKLLTGAMLSVLLSLVAGYPALAQTQVETRDRQSIAQARPNETIRGTIQRIGANNQVVLRLPNGETQVVEIDEIDRERLGLLPGMEIMVTLDDTGLQAEEVTVMEPTDEVTTTSTSTTTTTTTPTTPTSTRVVRITGDVISCEGTILQLRLPDGSIRNYVVTPDVCTTAVIVPGNRVELDVDESNNVVSNVQQPVRALW